MWKRNYWLKLIKQALQEKPIIWLAGVRRAGKTTLTQSLENIIYLDCELPSVRREIKDPESFLSENAGRLIVLDEIHRLDRPTEILKIAADHFPTTKIIATGSSTLGASKHFKDTLTGRKRRIILTPLISEDLKDFQKEDIKHRLLLGGLPPFFLTAKRNEIDFQEWIDSFWAKDIQELFRVERRRSFLKFAELLFVQSGGIFEASSFATPCEVSRTTIATYLSILEETFIVNVVRPFFSNKNREIVSAPKVYGFDTGFVCHHKGWNRLRDNDCGQLWEHFVLNELVAKFQSRNFNYWRDKNKHEIDFVIPQKNSSPIALECKWNADDFDPGNLLIFRKIYPNGKNFVIAQNISKSFKRSFKGEQVNFIPISQIDKLV